MSAPSHAQPPPKGDRLLIQLADVPPEGAELVGQLPATFFDLEPGGPKPVSPVRYRLHVDRDGDRLTVQGEVSADFSFDCVRCLEAFTDRITLDGYLVEEEVGPKTPSVDLTDRVREDILLALPGHPRCEEGSLQPRSCPASEVFPNAGDYSSEHPEEKITPADSHTVWGALDRLDLQAAPNPPKPSRRTR